MGKAQRKVTRKQIRKRERQLKKAKKDRFFRRTSSVTDKDSVSENSATGANAEKIILKKSKKVQKVKKKKKPQPSQQQIRKRQLLDANKLEDRNISSLAKKMKLNRRKSKNLPQSFVNDGLDYILEVCDPNTAKNIKAEPDLVDSDSDLEEVVANVTGKNIVKTEKVDKSPRVNPSDEGSNIGDSDEGSGEMNSYDSHESEDDNENVVSDNDDIFPQNQQKNSSSKVMQKETKTNLKAVTREKTCKKVKFTDNIQTESETQHLDSESYELSADDDDSDNSSENEEPQRAVEDIYGRVLDASGKPVQQEKYIPRLKRQALEGHVPSVKQTRLKKQLKGLMNRLSESNLQRIGLQIEELYQSHSRNDMNETLTQIVMESLIQNSLTPERLIQEHALLVSLLHANVGVEVGAYFLQTVVEKMDGILKSGAAEGKELVNIAILLSSLYTFKVSHSLLIFDLLRRFGSSFEESDLELILIILRSVGFHLRKDDPVALKEIIVMLQTKASQSSQHHDQSRVAFMLDCLLAIKNNNFQKIPNYDPSYAEHLKKLLRGITRKGCFGTELRISLQDLLDSEKRGRWWIVGSSWVGEDANASASDPKTKRDSQVSNANSWNKKILSLAQRQRMNTDVRKTIFCVVMTAEDFLDCYEKLTKLGLRNQQEREIVYVVLDCCLHEEAFNPYYAHLATKLCSEDRKLQMGFQFAIWDHLKDLQALEESKLVNLAQLVSRLLLKKGLSLSVLKVIQFADMDKFVVKFLRHVLLGILLCDSDDDSASVFERISTVTKLGMLREGLRLFMHHLLIKHSDTLTDDIQQKLKTRIKTAENALSALESGVRL